MEGIIQSNLTNDNKVSELVKLFENLLNTPKGYRELIEDTNTHLNLLIQNFSIYGNVCRLAFEESLKALKDSIQAKLADGGEWSAEDSEQIFSLLKSSLESILTNYENQAMSYVTSFNQVKALLSDICELEQNWIKAADWLTRIDFGTDPKFSDDNNKLEVYIKILRLYLEDDETVKAEPYLNRAALLVYPETIPDLQIPFKFCQARILDATKKFLLAGWKFLDLACTPQIAEVDRLNCYKQAIKCAILAEAGPARSRLLAALYKDPRYKDLDPEIMHTVLEYVYVGRILPNTMKLEFAEHLDPNHLAILADGSTLLDRAVMEHNIKSISSLYTSIRFDQLANILGSDEDTVEIITGTMISSGRLKGAIDQDYQVLEFIDDKIDEQYGIGVQEVEEDDLPIDERITTLKLQSELGLKAHEFDVSIKTICSKLDNIVDLIDAQVPTEWISLNR